MKKSTLVAMAVFSALALAFLLTREEQVSVGVRNLTLIPVLPESFEAIELGGTPGLAFKKADGGWTVATTAAPDKAYPADQNQVGALTRSLALMHSPDFVTDRPERQAELELDEAKGVTVKGHAANIVVRELVVGKASKGGGSYVRQAGQKDVFAVTNVLAGQVRRPLKDWREKRVVVAKYEDVARIDVAPLAGPAFGLVRDGAAWKLEGATPADFHVDADAATQLASQLTTLMAHDFLDEPTPPARSVAFTFTLKSGESRVLRLSEARPDESSSARLDGQGDVWLIPAWSAKQLRAGLEGLRQLRLMQVDPKDVERLTLTGAKGKAVVQRDGAGWKLVEPKTPPAGLELDLTQVDAVLSRLTTLRAAKVAEPGAKPGLAPTPLVELALKGGGKASLSLGAVSGTAGERYVKGTEPLVFVVNEGALAALQGGVEAFKKPPPAPKMMGGMGGNGLDSLPPEVRAKLEAAMKSGQLGQH